MKTSHKMLGSQIGKSYERVRAYEESIDALGDEQLIDIGVKERLAVLSDPIGPNFLRGVVIGVMGENLRRAKLNLRPDEDLWGITNDNF